MTPFSNQVDILSELYLEYSDDEQWQGFLKIYDLGIPLAVAIANGGASANSKGESWINESYIALCELLQIDSHGNYESLEDMLELANEE